MKVWQRFAIGTGILAPLLVYLFQQPTNQTSSIEDATPQQHHLAGDTSQQQFPPVTQPEPDPTQAQTKAKPNTTLSFAEGLLALSQQKVIGCKNLDNLLDVQFAEYATNKNFDARQVIENWSKSNQPLVRLAAVLAQNTQDEVQLQQKQQALKQIVKDDSSNKIAQFFLVTNCVRSNNCNQAIFDNAIANDPYNGMLWKQLAMHYAKSNNIEATLDALNNQISAPNYNSYWPQSTHLFEQALTAIGMAETVPRQVMAIGFSSGLSLTSPSALFDFCREYSLQRADVAQACLDSGKNQFLMGDNLLEQNFGIAQQKLVFRQLEQPEKIAELEKLRADFELATTRFALAIHIGGVDPSVNQYWWENLGLYGETKALELTYRELVNLSSDPDYNPCPDGERIYR